MAQQTRWRKGRTKIGSVFTKERLDTAELHCSYDKHEWTKMGIRVLGNELYVCGCGMVSLARRCRGADEPGTLEPLWGLATDTPSFHSVSEEMVRSYWAYRSAFRLAGNPWDFRDVFMVVIASARRNASQSLHIQ